MSVCFYSGIQKAENKIFFRIIKVVVGSKQRIGGPKAGLGQQELHEHLRTPSGTGVGVQGFGGLLQYIPSQ